jgi:hypothetical protein
MDVFDRLLATDEEINAHRQLVRQAMARANAKTSKPSTRSAPVLRPISVRLFGTHEGVRRLSITAATGWGLSWLVYAAVLQADLWNTRCYYDMCRGAVSDIWRAIVLAALGPLVIAIAIRIVRWIREGFRGQET